MKELCADQQCLLMFASVKCLDYLSLLHKRDTSIEVRCVKLTAAREFDQDFVKRCVNCLLCLPENKLKRALFMKGMVDVDVAVVSGNTPPG